MRRAVARQRPLHMATVKIWASPLTLPMSLTTALPVIGFSKAFNVVSHPKLFSKLHSYGIRCTVLTWLKIIYWLLTSNKD